MIGARQSQSIGPLRISAGSEDVASAQAELCRFTAFRDIQPERAMSVDGERAGVIEVLKKTAKKIVVRNSFAADGLVCEGTKLLAILLPFLGGAYQFRAFLIGHGFELLFARSVFFRLCLADLLRHVRRSSGGMLLQFVLGVEASGEQIRSSHKGQLVVCKQDHRNEEFFGVVQLLGSAAALGAAFDGARQLRKMQNAQMGFPMAVPVVSEGTCDGFRSDEAEVVEIVGPGGMGKIGVDDAAGKLRAISRDAVKVILVGKRVEFGDELTILLDRSFDDENIDAAGECGSHHFAPFRFAARTASGTLTIARKKICAVSFLESVLDFLRAKKRAVLRVFNAVHINGERDHVPLEGLIFAQSGVVADDRTLLAGTAKPELYR